MTPGQTSHVRIRSIASDIGRWVLTIITGVLGLAFLAATLFAGWMFRQEIGLAPSG